MDRRSGETRLVREPMCGAARGVLLAILLAMLGSACEESAGPAPGNLPPVTYLSVQGAELDTVGYLRVLHWWGSDPDGDVAGYLFRWDGGWDPPPEATPWTADPSWYFTTATRDTFLLRTQGEYAEWTFSVRAIDDRGAVDPEGRTQRFRLENRLPQVAWSPRLSLPERSLPAVAFALSPFDPDGAERSMRYRCWLTRPGLAREEREPARTDTFTVADSIFALGPEAFGYPADFPPGAWTLHVIGVDEAGGRAEAIEHTWTVEAPGGEFLLIDNVGSYVPGGANEDRFFRAMMDSIAAGNYHVLELEEEEGFSHETVVRPLFQLFRGIVWYGGMMNGRNDEILVRSLSVAERGGLRSYLEEGGRLLLCARGAVGDSAGLSEEFSRDVLGLSGFFRMRGPGDPVATTFIVLPRDSTLQTGTGLAPDTLRTTSTIHGVDFFELEADATSLFRVPPGFLRSAYPDARIQIEPDQMDVPAHIGVLSSRQGRCAVLTFLLSRANGRGNRDRVGAALFRRVLLE